MKKKSIKILINWDPIGNILIDKLGHEYSYYAKELVSRITLNGGSKEDVVDYLKKNSKDIVGIDLEENTKLRSDIVSITEQIWTIYQLKKSNQQEE